MLALFPFEPPLYEARSIPIRYVGHPLADEIAMRTDRTRRGRGWAWTPAPGSPRFSPAAG